MVFNAIDSFELRGKGTAYTGPCPVDCKEECGHDLLGRYITIMFQGKEISGTVKGVEYFAVIRAPKKGDSIGILI